MDRRLTGAVIESRKGRRCRLRSSIPLKVASAGSTPIRVESHGQVLEFDTTVGAKYVLTAMDGSL
jgi:hypothetical protein